MAVNFNNYATPAPAYRPTTLATAAQPSVGYAPTTYTPSATAGTSNTGGMIAAGVGAFAGFKWALPAVRSVFNLRSPGALLTAGVIGGSAYLGYKLWNKVTGREPASMGTGGNTMKYAAWGGGALGAFALARQTGMNPAGWALAAVAGAGAFAGNWIYKKLTGQA